MSTISYRLDLVMNLIDTTTGRVVNEKDVFFYKEDQQLLPEPRDEGVFILMNTGRESFDLTVRVRGYEEYQSRVDYETLDERIPLKLVYLIPTEGPIRPMTLLSYRDRIPKLEAIEAITLLKPRCFIGDYNKRRQEMTVFQSGSGNTLSDVHYGLLHEEEETFTHIEIKKNISDTKVVLAEPLLHEFTVNAPIYRIIFGSVQKGGSFLLRVAEEAKELPVIIRYLKNDEWYYLKTDFHELKTGSLKKAKKVIGKEET